jgi:hypothetical protein
LQVAVDDQVRDFRLEEGVEAIAPLPNLHLIHRHLDRFWRLIDALEHGTDLPRAWLVGVEREDGLFPQLNAADWASRG